MNLNNALNKIANVPDVALIFIKNLPRSKWNLAPLSSTEPSFLCSFAQSHENASEFLKYIFKNAPPTTEQEKNEWKKALFLSVENAAKKNTSKDNFQVLWNVCKQFLLDDEKKELVEKLVELSKKITDSSNQHHWWKLAQKLVEENDIVMNPNHWCMALDVIWRNSGISKQDQINGMLFLKKTAPKDLNLNDVAHIVALIPYRMRSDDALQVLLDIGIDKDKLIEDQWDGDEKSPKVPLKFKEMFSPVFWAKNKDWELSEHEWRGLWWHTKWLADQLKCSSLDDTDPPFTKRVMALSQLVAKRGANTKDLFLAVESAWDEHEVLNRIATWSVLTGKTDAQVWATQNDNGVPLWMEVLARHPTMVLQTDEQARKRGFWKVFDWSAKDWMGRDALAYIMAGILGVVIKDPSALWITACTRAGIPPINIEADIKFAEIVQHPYEKEWKSRLAQAVDIAMQWSTTRVSHAISTEIMFERGAKIASPTWNEVKNLLPIMAQGAFNSQSWGWLNAEIIEIGIKDLEIAVKEQPELVNWAGGYTLWRLIFQESFIRKDDNVIQKNAIKSWVEMGLDCEKWGGMLKRLENVVMFNNQVEDVKKWWEGEIQPLWERKRLKDKVYDLTDSSLKAIVTL